MEKFIKKCPVCDTEIQYNKKALLRQSLKRNSKCNICYKEGVSLMFKGKQKTDEHKKKLSKLKKGINLSEEHKKNISIGGKGKKRTLEQKQNYKKSKTGDKNPSKQSWVRKKTSNSITKLYLEKPEIKQQISNSLKLFFENNPDILNNRKAWSINQFSDKFTSIELKVKNILDELCIENIHNKKIGKYWADFTIGNKIIETDGSYWHSKEKDDIKDEFLIKEGYCVLRLSEDDINKNIETVRSKIIEFCK